MIHTAIHIWISCRAREFLPVILRPLKRLQMLCGGHVHGRTGVQEHPQAGHVSLQFSFQLAQGIIGVSCAQVFQNADGHSDVRASG